MASICICNLKACRSVCLDWLNCKCRGGQESYSTVAEKLVLLVAIIEHEVTKFFLPPLECTVSEFELICIIGHGRGVNKAFQLQNIVSYDE